MLYPLVEKIKTEIDNKKAQLIDVREQDEWDIIHFEQAILLPLSYIKENDNLNKRINSEIKSYLHCKKGMRAKIAKYLLEEKHGFKECIVIDDSFENIKSINLLKIIKNE